MTMHFMEKPPDFFDIVKFIIASFPLFRNGFPAKNRLRRPVSPPVKFCRKSDKISAGNRRLFYGQISFFQVYCSQEQ